MCILTNCFEGPLHAEVCLNIFQILQVTKKTVPSFFFICCAWLQDQNPKYVRHNYLNSHSFEIWTAKTTQYFFLNGYKGILADSGIICCFMYIMCRRSQHWTPSVLLLHSDSVTDEQK